MGIVQGTPITPEAMVQYQATAQRRVAEREAALTARRQRAWDAARRAASYVRVEYAATRVVLFGSLARGRWFTETSDIDLAAWGIPAERYLEAVSRIQEIDPEFAVDLVWMERCRPALAEHIAHDGIDL